MIGVPQPAQVVSRPAMVRPASNMAAAPVATQSLTPMVNGVPVDIINYFNIDIRNVDNRENSQLSEIYKLLKNDSKTDSDVILEISTIERKLGSPAYNESRYGKIWSYLKINSRIEDMEKQKRAMEINVEQ